MLRVFTAHDGQLTQTADPGALGRAIWIDLQSATEDERSQVQQDTGLMVPTLADISEIETSSRLGVRNGTLYLNMPLITASGDAPAGTHVGFVLSRDRLITVRFAESSVFNTFIQRLGDTAGASAAHIFTALLEAIVDRQADALEHVRDELDMLSHTIFTLGIGRHSGRRTEDATLKRILGQLGRIGDLLSHIRDTELGASRIVPYAEAMAVDWLPPDLHGRMQTLKNDIASVSEFDKHLSDKLQFLLDATLGFINIAQNNVMKVMAIASVVGIPPVLIVGIYGMNFKDMPELNWAHGYAYAWILIIISTLAPLLVFRWRKWI